MGKKKAGANGSDDPTAAETKKGLAHMEGNERYYLAKSKLELIPFVKAALLSIKKSAEKDANLKQKSKVAQELAEQFDKVSAEDPKAFTEALTIAGQIVSMQNYCLTFIGEA